MIKPLLLKLALLFLFTQQALSDQGFSESAVTLYGKVYNVEGSSPYLLQDGELEFIFVNQDNSANVVSLKTSLAPTGVGVSKPFSYSINVPLKFLPEQHQSEEYLSVGQSPTSFHLQSILLDGTSVTLQDGSQEFYVFSMAERAGEIRLDLYAEVPSTDTDQDGLPDPWERTYGFSTVVNNANEDPDGDGWTNLEEFNNGTDPLTDNRIPTLLTGDLHVPEKGEIAVYLKVVDVNTPPASLNVTIDFSGLIGVAQVSKDGVNIVDLSLPVTVTQEEVLKGALTIRQQTPWDSYITMPTQLTDTLSSDPPVTASLGLYTTIASRSDGYDSLCWYDASVLNQISGTVPSLPDRSGNTNTALQTVPAYTPRVSQNMEGLAQVDFNAPGSHLFIPQEIFNSSAQTVICSVSEVPTEGRFGKRYVWSTMDSTFYIGETLSGDEVTNALVYRNGTQAAASLTPAGDEIFTMQSSSTGISIGTDWSDSFQTFTPSVEAPVFATLGNRRGFVDAESAFSQTSFLAKFEEMLIFPQVLKEQRLRKIQNYLRTKWKGAILWDQGEEFSNVTLLENPSQSEGMIIQGGWGNDILQGSGGADVIAGGAGNDTLSGGLGKDIFLFTSIDTGQDCITDFIDTDDQMDFSKLFSNVSGRALDYLTLSYTTDVTSVPPKINTVITLARPDGKELTVTLKNTYLTESNVKAWIVEGVINMGALTVDQQVNLAFSSTPPVLKEGEDSVQLTLTRAGEGTEGSLTVPLALAVNSADSAEFYLSGSAVIQPAGNRAYVRFNRGETVAVVTLHPLKDSVQEGVESWSLLLPSSHMYTVSSAPLSLQVDDGFTNVTPGQFSVTSATSVGFSTEVTSAVNTEAYENEYAQYVYGAQPGQTLGDVDGVKILVADKKVMLFANINENATDVSWKIEESDDLSVGSWGDVTSEFTLVNTAATFPEKCFEKNGEIQGYKHEKFYRLSHTVISTGTGGSSSPASPVTVYSPNANWSYTGGDLVLTPDSASGADNCVVFSLSGLGTCSFNLLNGNASDVVNVYVNGVLQEGVPPATSSSLSITAPYGLVTTIKIDNQGPSVVRLDQFSINQ